LTSIRDTIRLVARLYTFCAAVVGMAAGIGAVSLVTWGRNLPAVAGACALLALAAVVVVTLLLIAQLFELLVGAAADLREQTLLLRRLAGTLRDRPEQLPE